VNPIWIVCPVLNNLAMTMDAIGDFLDQSVPTRVLIVNQGVDTELRQALERQAELMPDRLFIWSHNPPLPSLGASWNRALDFVWETGGTEALVANNDIRLHPWTIKGLLYAQGQHKALFVSAVAVTREQYEAQTDIDYVPLAFDGNKGGPDFSCFLITKKCHQFLRFDEGFIPAFCEDLSYHRELMLADEGARIFSVNLPYLHFGSSTLKKMSDDKRAETEGRINRISRVHYERCWGGPVNEERYTRKGDVTSARDGVTTPELQRVVQAGGSVREFLDGVESTATLSS
jgi:hypothetical protein